MNQRGDQLLDKICRGGNDTAANELLNEFLRGYPIDNLRRLLGSHEENAQKAGAWIASELGERVAPLLWDLVELLTHPLRYVRFFAIDAILVGATRGHGEAIARAILLILDSDDAVRWKALRFLSQARIEQIRDALPYLRASGIIESVKWLLRVVATNDTSEITAKVNDQEDILRKFAAVAAARLADHDLVALEHAAASHDSEISSFAKEELERFGSGSTGSVT